MEIHGRQLLIPTKKVLDYIDEYMMYKPDTGVLYKFYLTPQEFRSIRGVTSEGYIRVYILKKEYRGHHICWYLHYGKWPTMELDHINRIRNDNKIANLREVTDAQQMANLTNQSEHGRCIWYKKRINRYEVCIRKNKIRNYLGVFKTIEEAVKARDAAEASYGTL